MSSALSENAWWVPLHKLQDLVSRVVKAPFFNNVATSSAAHAPKNDWVQANTLVPQVLENGTTVEHIVTCSWDHSEEWGRQSVNAAPITHRKKSADNEKPARMWVSLVCDTTTRDQRNLSCDNNRTLLRRRTQAQKNCNKACQSWSVTDKRAQNRVTKTTGKLGATMRTSI